MPKELKPTLEQIRQKFDAKTKEIREEYGRRTKELEAKIEHRKRERDTGLARAERQFRRDSGVAIEAVIGEEDYAWLRKWLMKNKEEEIAEAGSRNETKRVNRLQKMSFEDYLFHYFNRPDVKRRFRGRMKRDKSEESARFSSIVVKLKLENLRLDRTLI